jgi:NADPH:quinone reductase-like Zn-dependent oxidoreductase
MKAMRIYSYGHSDQIRLDEIAQPVPKENEILCAVHDASVNPIDWKIREGLFRDMMASSFPFTLGQDFSGEVVQVGLGVRSFKKGDRVYGTAHGAYAEFVCVGESTVAKIPSGIDFITAASIPTAGLTAYQLIMKTANLRKGQSVLIHGAGGGVGSFAAQLALWKNARVYATASSIDFEYLKGLGLRDLIDYEKHKFEERIKDVDVVLDLVGGEILKRSFAVVKRGGMIATTVGPVDAKLASERGCQCIQFVVNQNSEDLAEMAKLVEKGILKPRIQEILPLEQAQLAQDHLQRGHAQGKIILDVKQSHA